MLIEKFLNMSNKFEESIIYISKTKSFLNKNFLDKLEKYLYNDFNELLTNTEIYFLDLELPEKARRGLKNVIARAFEIMRITILKNGNQIGSLTPYLGMIIGSPNSVFRTGVSAPQINKESIVISAIGIRNPNSSLIVNFFVKSPQNINFGNINNKISFMITSIKEKYIQVNQLINMVNLNLQLYL